MEFVGYWSDIKHAWLRKAHLWWKAPGEQQNTATAARNREETSSSCSSTMASSRTLGRIQHMWEEPSPDWINLAAVGPTYRAWYDLLQEGLASQTLFYFYRNSHHRWQYNFKTLCHTESFNSSSVTVSAMLCWRAKTVECWKTQTLVNCVSAFCLTAIEYLK